MKNCLTFFHPKWFLWLSNNTYYNPFPVFNIINYCVKKIIWLPIGLLLPADYPLAIPSVYFFHLYVYYETVVYISQYDIKRVSTCYFVAVYDFTGRQQYHYNRSPRQTTRESFHFPTSDNHNNDGLAEYSDVTYPAEGRNNGKSGRRAKLPAEFQDTIPEEQTEYLPAAVGSEEARYLSPQAIAKISETLGAINTVGRYLVNYTRGTSDDRLDSPQNYPVSKYIFIENIKLYTFDKI